MEAILKHFTDNDLYTFTCQYYILEKYPRAEVEYTFFDRNGTCYPQGFAELLREQLDHMKNVVISDEEVEFMTRKCVYLPLWYFTFLRGYRFNPNELCIAQDTEGHLEIKVKGKWFSTIMWEMPILSCISELSHKLNGDFEKYNAEIEEAKAKAKTLEILQSGIILGDMGTRRRFSYEHHDMVVRVMKETQDSGNWPGKFSGTSNVWLALKHDCTPLGTMSHQLISFEENVSGVFECNFNVMRKFSDVYDGDNGIYLYDCFGDQVFFSNLSKRMAMMYKGLRVDSGDEFDQIEKIISKYEALGIDPRTKQVVFSNGLDIEKAIAIHKYCDGRLQDSYGIGTFLTCDIEDCSPMNIVVKLTKARITETREWHDCVKLSCNLSKTLGDKRKCEYLQELLSSH